MRIKKSAAALGGCLLIIVMAAGLAAQPLPDSSLAGSPLHGFSLPVDPEQYMVRPGERLEVVFLKRQIIGITLTVDFEGRVINRDLGRIEVGGKALSEVRRLLLEPLKELYNADDIAISVGSIYPVAIQVTGHVNRPGTYVGYTSQRVSEMIDSAGGIAPGGSSRLIRFVGGASEVTVDLALAEATGNLRLDPCLYAGRRIVVPPMAQAPVVVYGEVNRPGVVELLPGDDISRLIELAGGARPDAAIGGSVAVNDRSRDVQSPGSILPGDRIRVPSATVTSGLGEVILTGAVAKAGRRIPLTPQTQILGDLLGSIGGVEPYANGGRIAIFRLAWDPVLEIETAGRYPVWIGDAGSDRVALQPSDSIHVPRKLSQVEVTGSVKRVGLYPYQQGKNVGAYITMAGGFSDDVSNRSLELFDRVSGLTRVVTEGAEVLDGDRIVVREKKSER